MTLPQPEGSGVRIGRGVGLAALDQVQLQQLELVDAALDVGGDLGALAGLGEGARLRRSLRAAQRHGLGPELEAARDQVAQLVDALLLAPVGDARAQAGQLRQRAVADRGEVGQRRGVHGGQVAQLRRLGRAQLGQDALELAQVLEGARLAAACDHQLVDAAVRQPSDRRQQQQAHAQRDVDLGAHRQARAPRLGPGWRRGHAGGVSTGRRRGAARPAPRPRARAARPRRGCPCRARTGLPSPRRRPARARAPLP